MTKQNAETKLYQSVTKAALQGHEIRPGSFGATDTWDNTGPVHVCLCGAVLAAIGMNAKNISDNLTGEAIIKKAAKVLGITLKQASSLNNGFEGEPKEEGEVAGASFYPSPLAKGVDTEWYKIGKSLRKVYDARVPNEVQ